MTNEIKKKVSEWREYILLLLALLSLLGILANAYSVSKLAPIEKNIATLTEEVKANEIADEKEHPLFVTKDTFNVFNDRINHISSRVDLIYSLISRK